MQKITGCLRIQRSVGQLLPYVVFAFLSEIWDLWCLFLEFLGEFIGSVSHSYFWAFQTEFWFLQSWCILVHISICACLFFCTCAVRLCIFCARAGVIGLCLFFFFFLNLLSFLYTNLILSPHLLSKTRERELKHLWISTKQLIYYIN